MTDSIAHRGPDGEGIWVSDDGFAGLGHRRLAIVDLSAEANQPMHDVGPGTTPTRRAARGPNRGRTLNRACISRSTAKSTTIWRCGRNCRPKATSSAPAIRTPRF
ncbi:MAG: hypothetical protein ACYYKD_11250 [Rhodospirillales bacterium]